MKHRTALSASILVAVSGTAALAQPADLIANAPRVVVATTYNGTTVGATNDGISIYAYDDVAFEAIGWIKKCRPVKASSSNHNLASFHDIVSSR